MAVHHSKSAERDFVFRSTPAVTASRTRRRYIDCAVCEADNSEYLFHRTGVRFVRCRTCGLVYTNPVGDRPGSNYFDVASFGQHQEPSDRQNLIDDFKSILERVRDRFEATEHRASTRTLWIGRWLAEYEQGGLALARLDDDDYAAMSRGESQWLDRWTGGPPPDIIVLDEILEASGAPGALLAELTKKFPDAFYVITYANAQSLPARTLRRHWPRFFEHKRTYFSTGNVTALMARYGFALTTQFPSPTHVTVRYGLARAMPSAFTEHVLTKRVGQISVPVRVGNRVAMFRQGRALPKQEKLSIVLPVYNEARYVRQVIEAILSKPLPIARELIIVESNSKDGTREIVREFEQREGVRVLFEDGPRGKGHAVRTGLAAVSGTIILIQDADFEYDIDDYDALIAPILQRKTAFVLGSRSLGLDDWKVRQFAGNPLKRFALNAAQVAFAKTFNVLYQQRTTDVNTMFKVFRTECLDGIDLESDRFSLDIELVCKLVKNGHAPVEVPINYVARGFDEGKKVSFVKDALPSYFAFFRYRFGS